VDPYDDPFEVALTTETTMARRRTAFIIICNLSAKRKTLRG